MAKPPVINNPENIGSYVWRGGEKIELEKQTDRFTVMPASQNQLERLRGAPGVRNIKPVTNQVFKVETTATENDATMATLRSEAFGAVAHHAYRPKGSKGTLYYLTDKIIVHFVDRASTAQIDELLEKYGLKLFKDYEEQERTYLVGVTSSSGENPIKVANRLAEE
jgi:hypothetical protein